MKKLTVESKAMKLFVKRCSIMATGDAALLVSAVKHPQGAFLLCGAVQSATGEGRITSVNMVDAPEDAGGDVYMKFVAKAADFLSLADMEASLVDSVSICEENGAFFFATEGTESKIKIPTIAGYSEEQIGINKEKIKASVKIKKSALIRLFRDGVKSVSDKLDHPAGIGHAVLHIGKDKFYMASTDGARVSYSAAGEGDVTLADAPAFDVAVKEYQETRKTDETALEIGVPFGLSAQVVSALSTTEQDVVVLRVDDRFIHVTYDSQSIISIAQAAVTPNISVVLNAYVYNKDYVMRFVVDKDLFTKAMALPMRARKISGAEANGMGIRLMQMPNGINLSFGKDCSVTVSYVGTKGEGEVDMFLHPDHLSAVAGAMPSGNLLMEVISIGKGNLGVSFSAGDAEGRPSGCNVVGLTGLLYETQKSLHEKLSAGALGTDDTKSSEGEAAEGDA